MGILDKLSAALERKPGDVVKEQMEKLYYRLFPYIVKDFLHKSDINQALGVVTAELAATKRLLRYHIHTVASVGAGATSPPTIPIPEVAPGTIASSALGESLVVPGGVLQPVGGEISIQPSRIATNPIAIPAFDPLGIA